MQTTLCGAWVVCVYLDRAVEGLKRVNAFNLTPFSFEIDADE